MKTIIFLCWVFLLSSCMIVQSKTVTVTFQPGSDGKDARLEERQPNDNIPNGPIFGALEWTYGGIWKNRRSVLEFDLNQIPPNATIVSAELSLYSTGHSTLSGQNDCYLRRLTGSWDENIITWNNQPAFSTSNQVSLPSSGANTNLDFLDIDISGIVNDWLGCSDTNFGMVIMLQSENNQEYRNMKFASGDHTDPNLHPKLIIVYEVPDPISFVAIKDELDGGAYLAKDGFLYLKYYEEYFSTVDLQVEIYNLRKEKAINAVGNNISYSYGNNLVQLNLNTFQINSAYLIEDTYYIAIISNAKNEKYMLRFLFDRCD